MGNSRVALVTGASRGLGAAIARRLGGDGFAVAVNYRHNRDLAEAVAGDINADGGRAAVFGADVTSETEVEKLVSDVAASLGRVEVLVINATGPQPELPFEEYEWSDFEDQIACFVKAPVLLVKHTLGAMKQARWGRILNIGSEVSENCRPIFSAYVAAKSAQLGLTRTWAKEFGPWNITVNSVNPGWIPTERHVGTPPESLDAYRAGVPLGRMGVPADVAAAIAFLASDDANFITGQRLSVNGGNTF